MNKTMTRVLTVALAVLTSFGFVGVASAQTYQQADPPARNASNFRYQPPQATANTGFLGFSSVNPQATPGAAAAGTGGGTSGGLAITGAETEIPLAIGVALVALGGTAVVAARKREDS